MASQNALLKSYESPEHHHTQQRMHEEARRATEPDPQLIDDTLEWTPELSLMLAILEDAIACYRKTLKRPRQNPEILSRQAEFWFRLDDWDSPFSFNNICEALRLDPEATRRRVFTSQQPAAHRP